VRAAVSTRAGLTQPCGDGFSDSLCAARDDRAQTDKFKIVAHQWTSKALIQPSADKPKR
jgi:hypothetical protein